MTHAKKKQETNLGKAGLSVLNLTTTLLHTVQHFTFLFFTPLCVAIYYFRLLQNPLFTRK